MAKIDLTNIRRPSPLCGCPGGYCEMVDGVSPSEAKKVLEGLGQRCQREVQAEHEKTLELEALEKKEGGRLDRDQLFMQMAELFAQRSTCLRGHTGAVVVRGRHPISVGYNGSPPGLLHCTEVGCEPALVSGEVRSDLVGPQVEERLAAHGCQRTIHAEINAILHAAKYGVSTDGCIMYTLSAPCLRCTQAILSAGITEVVWKNEYRADRLDLLQEAGVKVRRVS